MTYEVWDRKKDKMVEINDRVKYIAYKRDEYGKKVLVEPAKLTGATSIHFVFLTESGMDILINKNSDKEEGPDCFYSNKNSWSISLNEFEVFEELI